MKHCFVLLFTLSIAQFCWGQTAYITGRVVEQHTRLPVSFATAILFGETDSGLIAIDTFRTDQTAVYHFELDTVFWGYRILGNFQYYFSNEIAISGFKDVDSLKRDIGIEVEPIILVDGYISWLEIFIMECFKRMRAFPSYFLLEPFNQPFHLERIIERF